MESVLFWTDVNCYKMDLIFDLTIGCSYRRTWKKTHQLFLSRTLFPFFLNSIALILLVPTTGFFSIMIFFKCIFHQKGQKLRQQWHLPHFSAEATAIFLPTLYCKESDLTFFYVNFFFFCSPKDFFELVTSFRKKY